MKRKLIAILAAVMCLVSVFSLAACAAKYKVNEKENLLVGGWKRTSRGNGLDFYEDGTYSISDVSEGTGPLTFRYTETKEDEDGTYYEYETSQILSDRVTYMVLRYYPETDMLFTTTDLSYTRRNT